MSAPRYDGWVPFRIYWTGAAEPMVEWCYLGATPLTEPFFAGTIQLAVQSPFGSLFRRHSTMAELRRWRDVSPGVPPAGFIFQVSRCGSTLITQLLASLSRCVVLSEPEPVDAVALSHARAPHATEEQRVDWLRNIVSALGQPRRGGERSLFLKLEPRDIFMLPLFRRAYPDVPWLFLYRDPIEVLVSNLQSPSASLFRPGLPAGVDLTGVRESDEYIAAMLGAVLERAANAFPDPQAMLLEYRELPDAVWERVGRHFQLDFTADEVARLRDASQRDAKNPGRRFVPDAARKSRDASPRARALAERWLAPHFARLEALRVS